MPNTVNLLSDPKHLRDTNEPCESCGAKWTLDGRSLGALEMVHAELCAYWLALNDDGDEHPTVLADLIGSPAPVEHRPVPRSCLFIPGSSVAMTP